jgi:hypothetical protein
MLKPGKKTFLLKLFLILGVFSLMTAWVINPLLKHLLAKQVQNKLVGNFYYAYEDLQVDLIKRSVTFENVNWKFPKDTSILSQRGYIRQFKIEGISLLSFFGGSNIRIHEIVFDSLNLVTRIEQFSKKGALPDNYAFNFYSLIRGQIPGAEVKSVQIKNGNATWRDPENKKTWGKINNIQLSIDSFCLDSTTTATNNGWFSVQSVLLEGVTGELYLADSLHKIQTAKIKFDYQKSTIIIDSLKLIPLFEKSQMRHVRRYETNRLTLLVPRIMITGIDMKRMMVENALRIEKVLVDGLVLTVFRDKNPPFDPRHFPSLPQLALRRAHLNMKIDSVSIRNAFIEYEQLSDKTQKTGSVSFEKMDAELRNITNDSISYLHNDQATLQVSTQFMGISKLAVNVVFNLLDPIGDHSITGSLGRLDLTAMNKIFEPLNAISIRSGLLDQLNFNVRLNDDVSSGQIMFQYTNLRIDKLNENLLHNNDFDNTIKSLLANTFIIKNSNPTGGRDPRIGVIHFKRVKEKAILDFWLKSVLDGVRTTVLNGSETK